MAQELSSQDLLQYVETERATRLRRRGQEALYGSMIVGAFGLLGYTTCWVYTVLSDATNSIREMQQDAVIGQAVHPDVFSDKGYEVLMEYHRTKKGIFRGWNIFKFQDHWHAAKADYEARGTVRALPWAADMVKHWESILIRAEVIPAEEAMASAPGGVHTVDRIAGWVLNNRETYFGVVMAAMTVPALPVLAGVLKREKD